jgi:predicted RNA binding protein with dsRBD fold (UPF0201 family)
MIYFAVKLSKIRVSGSDVSPPLDDYLSAVKMNVVNVNARFEALEQEQHKWRVILVSKLEENFNDFLGAMAEILQGQEITHTKINALSKGLTPADITAAVNQAFDKQINGLILSDAKGNELAIELLDTK